MNYGTCVELFLNNYTSSIKNRQIFRLKIMGGGKFRHRIKKSTVRNGIDHRRWPKGGSSDSNPTTNRHRAAANAMRLKLLAQQEITTTNDIKRYKKMIKSTNNNEERVVSHIPLV
jgi:hypothetical protein